MKITDIECRVLLVPDLRQDVTSSAQDDIVVLVHTDEGITGIGESDVNPWMARACIEAPGTHTMGLGLKEMLIGENPLDTERLWEKLYVGSCMNGRRGAVIHAMGAIDMALWDLAGKALPGAVRLIRTRAALLCCVGCHVGFVPLFLGALHAQRAAPASAPLSDAVPMALALSLGVSSGYLGCTALMLASEREGDAELKVRAPAAPRRAAGAYMAKSSLHYHRISDRP